MKYRVECVMFFNELDDAVEAQSKIAEALEKAENVNCGTDWVEVSYWERERCFHDEERSTPCLVDERHEVECPPI